VIITIADVRESGICAAGARRWFDAYGFDFRDFMQNGIDSATLLATGDAYAHRVVAMKQERPDG